MKYIIIVITFLCVLPLNAQQNESSPGDFELGVRNTLSAFGGTGNPGLGFGGQFRIRVSERINTEWFADYIVEDIEGFAKRNDYHIGWSVMFYPFNPIDKKVVPYILAGHCFDYTKISATYNPMVVEETESVSRLSSATQVGLGTHFYLSPKFNLSLSSQYMIHLGSDIHAETEVVNGIEQIHIEEENDGFSLEGHLLFTLSLNYKIANLW